MFCLGRSPVHARTREPVNNELARRKDMDLEHLDRALSKLHSSIKNENNVSTSLCLWSTFIKLRDDGKCVECGSARGIAAHHIIRKCFLPEAQFLTGNGVTLCSPCHKYVHDEFNRRPDTTLPMDAQNGEKIELITALFGILLQNACNRRILKENYYYFSEKVLGTFKIFQGYDPATPFPGMCLEQAYYIWNSSPLNVRNALLEANCGKCTHEPFLPGVTVIFDEGV